MSPPPQRWPCSQAEPPVRVIADESSLPPEAGAAEIRARIEGAEIGGDQELFTALASELAFPSWFGANWDALLDCLRGVGGDRRPAAVTVIVEGAGQLLAAAPRTAALLIETWVIAALWWAQRGVPFRLLLLIES